MLLFCEGLEIFKTVSDKNRVLISSLLPCRIKKLLLLTLFQYTENFCETASAKSLPSRCLIGNKGRKNRYPSIRYGWCA